MHCATSSFALKALNKRLHGTGGTSCGSPAQKELVSHLNAAAQWKQAHTMCSLYVACQLPVRECILINVNVKSANACASLTGGPLRNIYTSAGHCLNSTKLSV